MEIFMQALELGTDKVLPNAQFEHVWKCDGWFSCYLLSPNQKPRLMWLKNLNLNLLTYNGGTFLPDIVV